MSNYNDETFKVILEFLGADKENYTIAFDTLTDMHWFYCRMDIEEIAYENFVVKKKHKKLTGKFFDANNLFFVSVKNNVLHCETGPAVKGINILGLMHESKHYIIYGKIMNKYSWLTWVKNTDAWTEVMAGLLGAKNLE